MCRPSHPSRHDTRDMMTHKEHWIVIGISGVTCGGKTTLANRLCRSISRAHVLHQDVYFYPDTHPAHVPVHGLHEPHNNYDILTALDMEQMYSDAVAIVSGEVQRAHSHHDDDATGTTDTTDTTKTTGTTAAAMLLPPDINLLIIEGFTALNYAPIFRLCDLRYYITLPLGECVSRRALRLYSPPDVPGYFELAVWPQHLLHRAEMENAPGVTFLDGTDPDIFYRVIRDLRSRGLTDDASTEGCASKNT